MRKHVKSTFVADIVERIKESLADRDLDEEYLERKIEEERQKHIEQNIVRMTKSLKKLNRKDEDFMQQLNELRNLRRL